MANHLGTTNGACIRTTVPEEAQDALKAYPRYSQAMFKKSLANLFLAHCRLSGLADDGAFIRHNAFQPQLAGVLENDRALGIKQSSRMMIWKKVRLW